jgi:serine kinase of HPr protein (carbohydrate metabolism regulator)
LSEEKHWKDPLFPFECINRAFEVVGDHSLYISSELGDELLGEFISLLIALFLEDGDLGINGFLVQMDGFRK